LQVFSSNFCAENGSTKTKYRLYLYVVQLKAVFVFEESRATTSTFIRIGGQRKRYTEFSLCTNVNIRGIILLKFSEMHGSHLKTVIMFFVGYCQLCISKLFRTFIETTKITYHIKMIYNTHTKI